MRAYRLTPRAGIDGLRLVDEPTPRPGRRQVLVKVAACSLNYRDLAIASGRYGAGVRADVVPLSDGAGTVVEIGEGVTRVAVGDRVAGCFFQRWVGGALPVDSQAFALGGTVDGMLAEHVVLEDTGVVKIPEHLSPAEAATLPCAALTAWHALVEHGRLTAGRSVLVQGTGGVSIFALQFARLIGAAVTATSSSDRKLEQARQLGAVHTINYKTRPDWDAAVRELTGGRGVDQVVEIGGAGTLQTSLGAIVQNGRISMIGSALTAATDINPQAIMMKRANLQGISVGSTEMFEAMNRAIAVAGLKPVIDRSFPFADAPAAYRHLEAAGHVGKVVIELA
jgi:NADPH:quinone reductase-like Zn-dependent oxidoreductase